MSVAKRFKPGDRVRVIDKFPTPTPGDGYLAAVHLNDAMLKLRGKMVTIMGYASLGYTIAENPKYWWRDDLLEPDLQFDEARGIMIDYDAFEALMRP